MIHYICHTDLSKDYFEDAHADFPDIVYLLFSEYFSTDTNEKDKLVIFSSLADIFKGYTLSCNGASTVLQSHSKKTYIQTYLTHRRDGIIMCTSYWDDHFSGTYSNKKPYTIDQIEDIVKLFDMDEYRRYLKIFKKGRNFQSEAEIQEYMDIAKDFCQILYYM